MHGGEPRGRPVRHRQTASPEPASPKRHGHTRAPEHRADTRPCHGRSAGARAVASPTAPGDGEPEVAGTSVGSRKTSCAFPGLTSQNTTPGTETTDTSLFPSWRPHVRDAAAGRAGPSWACGHRPLPVSSRGRPCACLCAHLFFCVIRTQSSGITATLVTLTFTPSVKPRVHIRPRSEVLG